MITITRLDESRWQDYRDLRLEALKNDPLAFGSSYEEEQPYTETQWRERVKNVLFAVSDGILIGMMVYVRSNRLKTSHICDIYSVYVKQDFRGQGISNMLMNTVLVEIKAIAGVKKIELTVNPTQKAARQLYRKYGFKEIGRARKAVQYQGKFYDELLMEKYL